MSLNDTYFYGQGKVSVAIRNADGTRGPYLWAGDVSVCTPKFNSDKITHKESWSGSKSTAKSFGFGGEGTIDMTWHSIKPENLAILLQGNIVATAAGTVTDEEVDVDLVVGAEFRLKHIGVSELVLTDSSAAPKTLVEGVDYVGDLDFGRGELLTTGFTKPIKAAYAHAATAEVGIFTAKPKSYSVLYEGINLAEDGAPVVAEFWNCTADVLQELALITDGNDVAGMQTTFNIQRDPTRPAAGPLGNFGRITQKAVA
jgi:hypothetical protein